MIKKNLSCRLISKDCDLIYIVLKKSKKSKGLLKINSVTGKMRILGESLIYSDKLTNQFRLKKQVTSFRVKQFFSLFVNNFLELLICQINILTTLRMIDFIHIFIRDRQYQLLIILKSDSSF